MAGRKGFTLVEMLLAVGITAVVVAELTGVLYGLFRMEREKMLNTEFADLLRVAREHILFRAGSTDGTFYYGGLIGASNVVWNSEQIAANLQRQTSEGSGSFDPEPFNLTDELKGRYEIVGVDDGRQAVVADEGGRITNDIVFVTVRATLRAAGGVATSRYERIAVPIQADSGEAPWKNFMRVTEIGWK